MADTEINLIDAKAKMDCRVKIDWWRKERGLVRQGNTRVSLNFKIFFVFSEKPRNAQHFKDQTRSFQITRSSFVSG